MPAHIYQPVVSPSSGWRNPFNGMRPLFMFSAMPTLTCGGDGQYSAPYLLQIASC